jgi:hypothetical protein
MLPFWDELTEEEQAEARAEGEDHFDIDAQDATPADIAACRTHLVPIILMDYELESDV